MNILSIDKLFKLMKPRYLCELLKFNPESNKRNKRIDYIPKFKCSHYQNNFCYQGPYLWNLLSSNSSICNEITVAPSINTMKSRLKKFLLKMQSYGQSENDETWYKFNHSIELYINQIKSNI